MDFLIPQILIRAAKPDRRLILLDSVTSTNDEAKRALMSGEDCVVIALSQEGGRGRLGRSFSSGLGGLYMSVSMKPNIKLSEARCFTALSAIAVSDAIEALCGQRPDIKWPNDLLVKGRKISGILTEGIATSEGLTVITGIGVNLKNELPPELESAGTLLELLGYAPEPYELAAEILKSLDEVFASFSDNMERLMKRYTRCCVTIGHKVQIKQGEKSLCGLAVGIDENAALLVKTESGVIAVSSGEATLRPD